MKDKCEIFRYRKIINKIIYNFKKKHNYLYIKRQWSKTSNTPTDRRRKKRERDFVLTYFKTRWINMYIETILFTEINKEQ